MKNILTLLVFLFISATQYAQSYKKQYADLMEPDSKIVSCEASFSIEKLKSGLYVTKVIYPETKMVTLKTTYKSKKFKVKHGEFVNKYDDGTIVSKGNYQDNKRAGKWIDRVNQEGEYDNGKRVGLWKTYGTDSLVTYETMYFDGKRHGTSISYDSLGQITNESEYENGELIAPISDNTSDTTTKAVEEMPRFPGCEGMDLKDQELHKCASGKLLTYVYSNLKYPHRAREDNIQGNVLSQFVVSAEGDVTEIKILNGVCDAIKKEALKLLNSMPKWRPGMKNGEAVDVLYTLPIRFRLE